MTTYARIDGGAALEIFTVPNGLTLAECWHPELAVKFSVCPDNVTVGSTVNEAGEWTIAPEPASAPSAESVKVSPVEFKLLFTPQERVAMKAARSTDPVIEDLYEVLDDPRLTFVDLGLQSTKDAIGYLVSAGLLAQARADEIALGVVR